MHHKPTADQVKQKRHFYTSFSDPQSSAAQTMAGKQSSPLCLHSSSYLTVLVLSCLLAASTSAPQAQKPREDRSTTQLKVDDIGVYFKWVVEAVNPEASTLSMEVSNSNVTLAIYVTISSLHSCCYLSSCS